MNRSPPMPFTYGCTTPITALAAIAASMALPPSSRMCAPACDARNCGAATIPNLLTTIDRPCPGTEDICGCCATTAGTMERDTAAARARSFIPFFLYAELDADAVRQTISLQ